MKLQRTLLLLNDQGRNLDVTAVLEPGRRFSITSRQGWSKHDEILARAPTEVRDDVAALVAMHLCDADGVPMHAIENSAYLIGQGDLDGAVRSLGVGATMEDVLSVTRARDVALTRDGGDALGTAEAEVVGSAKRCVARAKRVKDAQMNQTSLGDMEARRNLNGAVLDFDAAMGGRPEVVGGRRPDKAESDRGAALVGKGRLAEAEVIARSGALSDKQRAHIRPVIEGRIVQDALRTLVRDRLAPLWKRAADRAVEALAKPDYRVEGRPSPEVDERTYEGFARARGLTLTHGPAVPEGQNRRWPCTLRHEADGETYDFRFLCPEAPGIADVLECFQRDMAMVHGRTLDEHLDEMGVSGGVSEFRAAERAYEGCLTEGRTMRSMLGQEGLRALMCDVGDEPPLLGSDLDEGAFEATSEMPRP